MSKNWNGSIIKYFIIWSLFLYLEKNLKFSFYISSLLYSIFSDIAEGNIGENNISSGQKEAYDSVLKSILHYDSTATSEGVDVSKKMKNICEIFM